jgi:hypothetical protein
MTKPPDIKSDQMIRIRDTLRAGHDIAFISAKEGATVADIARVLRDSEPGWGGRRRRYSRQKSENARARIFELARNGVDVREIASAIGWPVARVQQVIAPHTAPVLTGAHEKPAAMAPGSTPMRSKARPARA